MEEFDESFFTSAIVEWAHFFHLTNALIQVVPSCHTCATLWSAVARKHSFFLFSFFFFFFFFLPSFVYTLILCFDFI